MIDLHPHYTFPWACPETKADRRRRRKINLREGRQWINKRIEVAVADYVVDNTERRLDILSEFLHNRNRRLRKMMKTMPDQSLQVTTDVEELCDQIQKGFKKGQPDHVYHYTNIPALYKDMCSKNPWIREDPTFYAKLASLVSAGQMTRRLSTLIDSKRKKKRVHIPLLTGYKRVPVHVSRPRTPNLSRIERKMSRKARRGESKDETLPDYRIVGMVAYKNRVPKLVELLQKHAEYERDRKLAQPIPLEFYLRAISRPEYVTSDLSPQIKHELKRRIQDILSYLTDFFPLDSESLALMMEEVENDVKSSTKICTCKTCTCNLSELKTISKPTDYPSLPSKDPSSHTGGGSVLTDDPSLRKFRTVDSLLSAEDDPSSSSVPRKNSLFSQTNPSSSAFCTSDPSCSTNDPLASKYTTKGPSFSTNNPSLSSLTTKDTLYSVKLPSSSTFPTANTGSSFRFPVKRYSSSTKGQSSSTFYHTYANSSSTFPKTDPSSHTNNPSVPLNDATEDSSSPLHNDQTCNRSPSRKTETSSSFTFVSSWRSKDPIRRDNRLQSSRNTSMAARVKSRDNTRSKVRMQVEEPQPDLSFGVCLQRSNKRYSLLSRDDRRLISAETSSASPVQSREDRKRETSVDLSSNDLSSFTTRRSDKDLLSPSSDVRRLSSIGTSSTTARKDGRRESSVDDPHTDLSSNATVRSSHEGHSLTSRDSLPSSTGAFSMHCDMSGSDSQRDFSSSADDSHLCTFPNVTVEQSSKGHLLAFSDDEKVSRANTSLMTLSADDSGKAFPSSAEDPFSSTSSGFVVEMLNKEHSQISTYDRRSSSVDASSTTHALSRGDSQRDLLSTAISQMLCECHSRISITNDKYYELDYASSEHRSYAQTSWDYDLPSGNGSDGQTLISCDVSTGFGDPYSDSNSLSNDDNTNAAMSKIPVGLSKDSFGKTSKSILLHPTQSRRKSTDTDLSATASPHHPCHRKGGPRFRERNKAENTGNKMQKMFPQEMQTEKYTKSRKENSLATLSKQCQSRKPMSPSIPTASSPQSSRELSSGCLSSSPAPYARMSGGHSSAEKVQRGAKIRTPPTPNERRAKMAKTMTLPETADDAASMVLLDAFYQAVYEELEHVRGKKNTSEEHIHDVLEASHRVASDVDLIAKILQKLRVQFGLDPPQRKQNLHERQRQKSNRSSGQRSSTSTEQKICPHPEQVSSCCSDSRSGRCSEQKSEFSTGQKSSHRSKKSSCCTEQKSSCCLERMRSRPSATSRPNSAQIH